MKQELLTLHQSKQNSILVYFPSISLSYSNDSSTNYNSADSNSYSLSIGLSKPLFDILQGQMNKNNLEIQIKEAGLNIKQRENELENDSISKYINILNIQDSLDLKVSRYRITNQLYMVTKKEVELGLKTEIDLNQVEIDFLSLELEINNLEEELLLAVDEVHDLAGIDKNSFYIIFTGSIEQYLSEKIGCEYSNELDLSGYYQLAKYYANSLDYLKELATENNFNLKKIAFKQDQLALESIFAHFFFLKNVDFSFNISFSGNNPFPNNLILGFNITFGLNFDIFSGNFGIDKNLSNSGVSGSSSVSGSGINSLSVQDYISNIEFQKLLAGSEYIEAAKNLDNTIERMAIKLQNSVKKLDIIRRQQELYEKQNIIYQTKLKLGEITESDYLDFLLEQNDYITSRKDVYNNMINNIYECESLFGMSLQELLGVLEVYQ